MEASEQRRAPPVGEGGRAQRALQLVARCNRALLRSPSEAALLEEVCRLVVQVGGWSACRVEVGGRTAAWPAASVVPRGEGAVTLPLVHEGERLGTVAVPRGPGDDDAPLLQPFADDLAYGLALLRARDERRRAKQALEARELFLRTVLETAFDGFWVVDAQGRLLEVNEAYCAMSGYTRDELLGMRVEDLAAVDPTEIAVRLEAVLATGSGRFEGRHRRKDGTLFDVEIALRGHGAGEGRVACFFRDLTGHKRLEEQLRQAQKLESVGRLAGGVAHDLNNILTVVLSCAEAIADGVSGELAEDVAEIKAAGRRARDLTRQLLAFARRQPIAPLPLDLNDTVRNAEKLLRRVLGEDVALEVALEPELWPVFCDPGQLDQVILNLAVNARDAMRDGGTLRIETRNAREPIAAGEEELLPGEWVTLVIADTGHGMTPVELEHLFEPFFTTKPKGQGSGLGLATVYGIVRQSEGHVAVDSAPGRGTRVSIHLPRTRRRAAEAGGPASAAGRRGTETVLVVDDEPTVRRIELRALRGAGYRVLEAGDAQEALRVAAAERGPIHVLVTDVVLPGASGVRLAEELAQTRPGAHVLFVSGYTGDALDQRGVAEGAAFLPKPFTPDVLVERVRAILDGPEERSPALAPGGPR